MPPIRFSNQARLATVMLVGYSDHGVHLSRPFLLHHRRHHNMWLQIKMKHMAKTYCTLQKWCWWQKQIAHCNHDAYYKNKSLTAIMKHMTKTNCSLQSWCVWQNQIAHCNHDVYDKSKLLTAIMMHVTKTNSSLQSRYINICYYLQRLNFMKHQHSSHFQ